MLGASIAYRFLKIHPVMNMVQEGEQRPLDASSHAPPFVASLLLLRAPRTT
jgi:hypothetical protein